MTTKQTTVKPVKPRTPSMVSKAFKPPAPRPEVPTKKSAAKEKGSTVIWKAGLDLSREVEEQSYQHRPLIWRDLPDFANRHGRTTADIVYDLSLLTSHAVALKTPKATVIPFDLELLIRMYDVLPSSCSWKRPDVRETFEKMYGAFINDFEKDLQPPVRLALGRRYAKMLGRVDTAQYRWLGSEGQITRRLSNILAKIDEVATSGKDSRQFFESLAKKAWLMRGFDVDKKFPLPTKETAMKQPGTRGRVMVPKPAPPATPVYKGGAFA